MNYSIITPTKNEGKYIEQTIQSVIHQTISPMEWLIMDDGSTDNTEQLVNKYINNYSFIKYIKLTDFRKDLTNTGGRVAAVINYANSILTKTPDIIGKIDGDVSFDADFFSKVIIEFQKDPSLGILSGHLVENNQPEIIVNREGCRGATLLLRYECFKQIGGLYESKTRGEDTLATVAARAKGWKTWVFDIYFNHLKPEGIRKSKIQNHYITGYYKGSIPYWFPYFLLTMARDMLKKPLIIGGFVQLYSYLLSRYIKRYQPFPEFVSKHYRLEQKNSLRKKLKL